MEVLKEESLARLRHDLRTPVNHILGFAELLIEELEEHRADAWLPSLKEIQDGGRRLLETIESGLGRRTDPAEFDSFARDLGHAAREVLQTSTALIENCKESDPQTCSDLNSVSRALHRLIEFSESGVLPSAQRRS
jgi:signal transduction histidine kinase